jgi:hypothetical protein
VGLPNGIVAGQAWECETSADLGDTHIEIIIDETAGTLTIRDRGIGMTEEEVQKYLNQVAFSSAKEFLDKYKSRIIHCIIDEFPKNINNYPKGLVEYISTYRKESFKTKEFLVEYIQNSNYLEYDITGELLAIPGLLSKKGIYYYIIEKQTIIIKRALEKDIAKEKYFMI